MNKIVVLILSFIVIMIAVFIATVVYRTDNNYNMTNIPFNISKENILDECTDEYEQMQEEIFQANSKTEKISPNCFITFKIKYNKCGHETITLEKVKRNLINKTQDDFKKEYNDWDIEKFSDTDIVLSKDEKGYCNEHYLVQDKEGKVAIYLILEDGTKEIYELTDISTEYLSNEDKIQIKSGIKVNGKQKLNQLIEYFE